MRTTAQVLVGGNISWSDVHGLVVYDELSLEYDARMSELAVVLTMYGRWGSYQGLKLSAGSSVC